VNTRVFGLVFDYVHLADWVNSHRNHSVFTTQNSITHLTSYASKGTRLSLPPLKQPKPKTVPKSFRVDESALHAVEKEAAAQQVSANTLVNQILTQFSEFDRFAKRINTVKPSSFVFRGLLDAVDSDKIIELAKTAGSSIPQAFVTAKGGKVDIDSLLDHLRALSLYAHLYEYSENLNPREQMATLVHDFGLNWSIFLVHYITAMFEQVSVSPKLEMSDRSVILSLPAN